MGKVANCAIFLADTDGVGHERVAVAGEWQMFPSIDPGPDTPPDPTTPFLSLAILQGISFNDCHHL